MSWTIRVENGDWVEDSNGRAQTVTGMKKLSQDCGQSILDEYDANRNYGSLINPRYMANKTEDDVFLEIHNALNRLISNQEENTNVTDSEKLSTIEEVAVERLAENIFYYFRVKNATEDIIESQNELSNLEVSSFDHLFPDFNQLNLEDVDGREVR